MKKIVIITISIVLVVICAAVLYVTKPDIKVAADSQILCDDSYVYYNDVKDRLCRVRNTGGRAEVIAEDAKLAAAYGDKVLVDTEQGMQVLNQDGVLYANLPDVHYAVARITTDSLYYLNTDGTIWRTDIDGGIGERVMDSQVKDFILYGKNIIYTPDGNSLLVYSMDSGSTGSVLSDAPIYDFSADDDYLFVTNANNGNTLLKIRSSGGYVEELLTIKTKTFAYKNGRLFYIENADSELKEYKLINDPIMVHDN